MGAKHGLYGLGSAARSAALASDFALATSASACFVQATRSSPVSAPHFSIATLYPASAWAILTLRVASAVSCANWSLALLASFCASIVLRVALRLASATLLAPATCAFATAAWVSAGEAPRSHPAVSTLSIPAVPSTIDLFHLPFIVNSLLTPGSSRQRRTAALPVSHPSPDYCEPGTTTTVLPPEPALPLAPFAPVLPVAP